MKTPNFALQILFVSISGCASNHIGQVPDALRLSPKGTEVPTLNKTGMQEDIQLLKYGLDRAYGAGALFKNEQFQKVFKDLDQIKLTSDVNDFCIQIADALKAFPDHHLAVSLDGKSCSKSDSLFVDVGNNRNHTKRNWAHSSVKITGKSVHTIAITGFPMGKWEGFEQAVKEVRRKADIVIIDLRGNDGGDDTNGKLMADILAGQPVISPVGSEFHRQTPEALIVWENYLEAIKKRVGQKTDVDSLNFVKGLQSHIDKNRSLLEAVQSGSIKEEYRVEVSQDKRTTLDPTRIVKAPIYILQDRKCISSCESTILYFESLPQVTKVGTPTGGYVHFGNIGVFRLKHSGIAIQIPTKADKFKDGRFIEIVGIEPDIVLKQGQDAYDYVIQKK